MPTKTKIELFAGTLVEGKTTAPSTNNSIKRQAEREDGQLLILPSEKTEEVGALSDPTLDLSSADKGTKSSEEKVY